MVGTKRTRTRSNYVEGYARRYSPAGKGVYVLTVNNTKRRPLYIETCTDTVGNRHADNALLITKETWRMEGLNGRDKNIGYREYQDYPGLYFASYSPKHISPMGIPSDGAALADAYTRVNPNRPEVDLPVAVFELREVPNLVKDYGELLTKKLAKRKYRAFTDSARQNLAWQFGLKPMIKDLKTMMDFVALVDRRERELERLYESGGLRKRVDLEIRLTKSAHQSHIPIDSNLSDVIYRDLTRITTVDRWATFRFKPRRPVFPGTSKVKEQALRAVLGLTLDASTAWKAIPWTWLVDWFASVGDYLQNQRNLVDCYCDSGCLMTRTTTTERYSAAPTAADFCRGAEGVIELVEKRRYVNTNPSTISWITFVDLRQTSILGSLAISRSSKYHL